LCRLDTETGLLPFLQAAVGEKADCWTILELLKKDPSLVKSLHLSYDLKENGDREHAQKALMSLGLEEKKEL
jgi:hypothetical protein